MYQYATEHPTSWPEAFIHWEQKVRKAEARRGNFNLRINYETLNYSAAWNSFTLTDFSQQILGQDATRMYRSSNPLHAQVQGVGSMYDQIEILQQCIVLCDLMAAAKYSQHERFRTRCLSVHSLKHLSPIMTRETLKPHIKEYIQQQKSWVCFHSTCEVKQFQGVYFEEAVILTLIERDALTKARMINLLECALT